MRPMNNASLRFKHIIIDRERPKDLRIKAAGDVNHDDFVDIVVASSRGPQSGMSIRCLKVIQRLTHRNIAS